MKNVFPLFLGLVLFAYYLMGCSHEKPQSSIELVTENDSIYYALGAQFSSSLTRSKLPLNALQFRNGYLDCEQGQSYINIGNVSDVGEYFRTKISVLQSGEASKTSVDSFSYAYGGNQFFQLQVYGLEVNKKAMFAGMEDYLVENGGSLDSSQISALMERFMVISKEGHANQLAELTIANKKKGMEFMIQKAAEKEVKVTKSGLRYKVIKEGTGVSPTETDEVKVHYEGRLINGQVFDSSIQRGEPTEFFLNGVIKGWTEGLQLMKTGGKYQFYIPSVLAYGDHGFPPSIGPGELLIFDVELLEVKR